MAIENGLLALGSTVIGGAGGGSEITDITQAEYDLLPEAEKNNGTIYNITDATYSAALSGTAFGSYTIASGSTSYVVSHTALKANSDIIVYFSNDTVSAVEDAGISFTQANGSLTLTFDNALASAVVISKIVVFE